MIEQHNLSQKGAHNGPQEVAEQIAKSLSFTDDEFYNVFPTQYIIRAVKNGDTKAIEGRL